MRAITTIDQIDSAYQEAGGDPFMGACILGSTQDTQPLQPAPQSPTTTESLAVPVDPVEGATR